MDKKRLRELKAKAQALDATALMGKEGITPQLVEEVRRQLDKKKLVKVRLLQSVEDDRREVAEALASAASAVLVEVRGRTVVLAKE